MKTKERETNTKRRIGQRGLNDDMAAVWMRVAAFTISTPNKIAVGVCEKAIL
jgi:hypothetical protein